MLATSDFNRSLSRIFTNPVFKQIIQSGGSPYFLSKLKKYDSLLTIKSGMKIKNVLEHAYSYLGKNYRNEYVYKNTLVNSILLGRHSVRTATMLNEFKVSNSIADVVVINGTSTVYEIKTELDSPEKLHKQLEDYRKAFVKIFLVTHHSLAAKYLNLVKDTSTGLLCLSGRFSLSVVKNADEDYSHLSNEVMMRCLRKEEYSAIIQQFTGSLPTVSNIHFFKECLGLALQMNPCVLHKKMLQQLRDRSLAESSYLESDQLPKEIKHICLCINPTRQEYNNLFDFLNLKL